MSVISLLRSRHARAVGVPLAALALIALAAIAGPVLWGIDPLRIDTSLRLAVSSAAHPLGCDEFGRDVLARLLASAQTSLAVAFCAALLAMLLGVAAGLLGGYFRGVAEFFTLRLADVILAFPPILLALLFVTFIGPGAGTLILVIGIMYTPEFARVTFGEVVAARRRDYVEAMRALGAGHFRILLGTILPNVAAPILVQISLVVAAAMILESGLSFLGLGVVPPTPSWGLMIRSARAYLALRPMLAIWPCLALLASIFTVNQLCDALRDAADPRQSARVKPHRPKASVVATLLGPLAAGLQLRVDGLSTAFGNGPAAVRDLRFDVAAGQTVAIVGESGSGKSVASLSLMGLLPENAAVLAGSAHLRTKLNETPDVLALPPDERRRLRGNDMAMIFQEPMTSLNPVYRIGRQIEEAVRLHRGGSRAAARARALEMIRRVGLSDPERRIDQYPHELSGGMRQRVMIALALSCDPRLLVADEPTTALDVTVQADILQLIAGLQATPDAAMGVIFITHNLGVVAQIADRVVVMYAGQIVETAPAAALFAHPRHPYTRGLLACIPRPGARLETIGEARLESIPGLVPAPGTLLCGCAFAPRCTLAEDRCRETKPTLVASGDAAHLSRCLKWSAL